MEYFENGSKPRTRRGQKLTDMIVIVVLLACVPYMLGFVTRSFWEAFLFGWRWLG